MSQVSIRRVDGNSPASQILLESLNGISDSIRNRAFQLSQGGGGNGANDTSDWLQAERDLYSIPQAQLAETDGEYRMQVAVPGVASKDLEVAVQGNTITVRSSSNSSSMSGGGSSGGSSTSSIQFSEFNSKMLLRRFELSSGIDTSAVTATLDNGMLSITAAKSTSGNKSSAAKA